MTAERQLPIPPVDKKDLAAQTSYLESLICAFFHISLSREAATEVRRLLWRVGPDNYEDLVSSVFLECWEERQQGKQITDAEVVRVTDRLRQRLLRNAQKTVATEAVAETPAAPAAPDDELRLVLHEFQTFLRGRSALDALLFQRYYLDGARDVAALAREIGLSPKTIYRRLKAIQDGFIARRDQLEPPHFQD